MVRPGRRSDSGNEPQLEGWKSFDDKAVRRKFVRKVSMLLTFSFFILLVDSEEIYRF